MLDHGGTACLSLLNIKELTPEVAALPLQALQVSLANVSSFLLILLRCLLCNFPHVCKLATQTSD